MNFYFDFNQEIHESAKFMIDNVIFLEMYY